ncbi:hypothetical protein L7F22_051500, partial [Adiantum nelumboides]|nr:hypothetical protein [Adiantum nelumboides]
MLKEMRSLQAVAGEAFLQRLCCCCYCLCLRSAMAADADFGQQHRNDLKYQPQELIILEMSIPQMNEGLYIEKLDDVFEGITRITTLETFLPYCIEEEAAVPQVKVVPKQMEAFITEEVKVIHEKGDVLVT